MDFFNKGEEFLTDVVSVLSSDNTDKFMIMKSMTQLLFCIFSQISQFPQIFNNMKKEMDQNMLNTLQFMKNEIQVLKTNQDNILKQLSEIKEFNQSKVQYLLNFPPVTEKPKDYKPNIFHACKHGK